MSSTREMAGWVFMQIDANQANKIHVYFKKYIILIKYLDF